MGLRYWMRSRKEMDDEFVGTKDSSSTFIN